MSEPTEGWPCFVCGERVPYGEFHTHKFGGGPSGATLPVVKGGGEGMSAPKEMISTRDAPYGTLQEPGGWAVSVCRPETGKWPIWRTAYGVVANEVATLLNRETATLRAQLAERDAEIAEGDYWQARAKAALEMGTCPVCFQTDEAGHADGCCWGQAETRAEAAKAKLARVRAIVDEQAEDDGLWFITVSCAEAYLQQELRRLHRAVEEDS